MSNRTPTQLLAIKGSFKHDPARGKARENEPEPVKDIGSVPKHLTAFERKCWNEIVKLAHPGTLCDADRLLIEHGAMILAKLRANRWVVRPELYVRFEMVLGKLGMTPADRSRVAVMKKKIEKNPYAEFVNPLADDAGKQHAA